MEFLLIRNTHTQVPFTNHSLKIVKLDNQKNNLKSKILRMLNHASSFLKG